MRPSVSHHRPRHVNARIQVIFDYECQDPKFSVDKIMRMQRHFCSPTDDGILYINYPMIEAYKDMSEIPDAEYYKKKLTGIDKPGVFYKNQVKTISALEKYLGAYDKAIKYCRKYYLSEEICIETADKLLSLKNDADLKDELVKLECFSEELRENMQHYMCNLIKQYVPENMSYWDRLRELFVIVASQNISKGYMLQQRSDDIHQVTRQMYEDLNYAEILSVQNSCSCRGLPNYVWVLSTCMCILGEYKFFWKK